MYCPACGMSVPTTVSYCNRCGSELRQQQSKANELSADSLVRAILTAVFLGLVAIVGLLALLGRSPEFTGQILAFAFLSFLLILAVSGIFLWLLLRSNGPKKRRKVKVEDGDTRELETGRAGALPEPGVSVIEHTTRTLEPVPRKEAGSK